MSLCNDKYSCNHAFSKEKNSYLICDIDDIPCAFQKKCNLDYKFHNTQSALACRKKSYSCNHNWKFSEIRMTVKGKIQGVCVKCGKQKRFNYNEYIEYLEKGE